MNRPFTLCFITLTLATNWASAQISRPAFEVASVKFNTNCEIGGPSGGASPPGRMLVECADLRDLILTAYGIYGSGANPAPGSFRMQVVGGPAWLDSARYNIAAKASGNPPRSEMFGQMLQSLLEDRFALKVHRETKEGTVYFLTVAKNGPKLQATHENTCVVADVNHPPEAGRAACGKTKISSDGDMVMVDIAGGTIANLCSQLNLAMDHEVIDRTGIAGRFDIHFEVARADMQARFVAGRNMRQQGQDNADDRAGPSISAALQQRLGLRLERGTGPVQVIVVDHIERPTEN